MPEKSNEKMTKVKELRTKHINTLAELDKYRLLVENVQDYAIFLLDKDGYVATWNKGAQRYKGYKPEEIIGKHFSVFYLARDIKSRKPQRELEIAKQLGRVEDEDWRVRKDGSHFWANVIITALYDQDGELVGFAKVTRDLTQRKQNEEKLRQANQMLRQQQEELQRLSVSKEEFVSLASHQLRTPATSIKQYLGMILEGFVGELTPEQTEFVRKAYISNEHQINIVNNLLRIAQIDAGKIVLKKTPTDIRQMITEVVGSFSESFQKRKQQVSIDISPSCPKVMLDPSNFQMVIENLVDNASKYTPRNGKIKVSVSIRKNIAKISIQDSGVGVLPENIPKLFEKFARIQNELTDKVSGSGLGLYWVNEVVKLHGGKIKVESKLGQGTTFNIYVPARGDVNA